VLHSAQGGEEEEAEAEGADPDYSGDLSSDEEVVERAGPDSLSSDDSTNADGVALPASSGVVPPASSVCEALFNEHGKSKRYLLAMCIGLTSEGRKLGDTSLEPYFSSKAKTTFRPVKNVLLKEVLRRAEGSSRDKSPRATNWNNAILTEWLLKNPVTKSCDVTFLKRTEKEFYDVLVAATCERARLQEQSNNLVWSNIADMRMVHCLLDDDVREAFIERYDVLNRPQLDARNSPIRPPTYLEKITEKYNSPEFSPQSEILPNLYEEFAESIDLSLDKVPSTITPEQAKSWLADQKTKLVLMINAWEKSGNGTGNRDQETQEEWGHMDDEHYQDDNRSSYLNANRSLILYFWHMADVNDMLQETVTVLNKDMSATTDNVPDVATGPSSSIKRKQADVQETSMVSTTFQASLRQRISRQLQDG
jgi:hypothetical protein